MKKIYRIATILLIILGTTAGPRAFTADHFDSNKKNTISKYSKAKPFEGFFIDPNPIDQILFSEQKKNSLEKNSTISIFSQCGCLVKQISLKGELNDDNLDFLSSGFYYLKINNYKGIEYRKILIN